MENRKWFCRFIALLLLTSGFFSHVSFAQKKDNFGKEFFVAFAENDGSGDEAKNFFALFITGKTATQGTVTVQALGFTQNFSVIPGQTTTIELPDGKNQGDPTVEVITDEQVLSGMAVHITANDEIAVYGLSHKQYSSDAFMALPVDVLGTTYRTLNYQTSMLGTAGTPSEFWIVGVSDGTNVKITPKAATAKGKPPAIPFTVQLNKGDVFLVQGDNNDEGNDLTGSLIESNNPVAVLSGHVRADIPHGFLNDGTTTTSRDHLVEQMPPVTAWGYSALIAPYATATLPDLVRIVSNDDGNKITANGVLVATLNAGDFFEITQLSGPVTVSSSNPILAGQYLHTSRFGTSGGGQAYGDPAYSLIFPVEQFDTSYTFMVDQDAASFTGNFINIVTCQSGFTDMMLDGKPVSSVAGFTIQKFSGSNYVFAQLRVAQGNHKVSGSLPFGITVYAMGAVDSYAYPGGSLLDAYNITSKHIEYAVSSKRVVDDTAGATVYLPIFIKKNGTMPSLDMVMHYPTMHLIYKRSEMLSGKILDVPNEQWAGRTKLHFDSSDIASLKDSLAGYGVFEWHPLEITCSEIIFDSLHTDSPVDPCTGVTKVTPLALAAKGTIGNTLMCGKADVKAVSPAGNISFRPNPAREFGSLLSEDYSGRLDITFINMLGVVLREQHVEVTAGTAAPLDLEFLPEGLCYVRISSNGFTKVIPFIHLR